MFVVFIEMIERKIDTTQTHPLTHSLKI